ncbi:MAG: transporter [Alphaproteobacteria bacterium]|nr:transporter [Alphaproteobacteria bacterium]
MSLHNKKSISLLTCLLVFAASPVLAEEASPEHGKINTPDATPVDPGHAEAELSYGYAFADRLWDSGSDSHTRGYASERALGLSLTAGLVENVDISLSAGYSWLKDKENDYDSDGDAGPFSGSNASDLGLSARVRFYRNEALSLDAAYIGGITIPTGSRADAGEIGTSQEYWSVDQTLAASKDWGLWTGNAALGYSLPIGEERHNARGALTADIAAGYQVRPWLQPELELNYSQNFTAHEENPESLALTAGLVMPLTERVRINAGVQQSLWGRNADMGTTLSLAVKLAF